MELALKVEGGAKGDETAMLRRWLLRDGGLRGKVTLRGAESASDDRPLGEMGPSALEFVDAAVSNLLALGSLLVSVASWRAARPSPPPAVRIEADGVAITVDTDDPETLRRLAETLGRTRPEE